MWTPTISACDTYLKERTGKYEWRAVRYCETADFLFSAGLNDDCTVVDVGAGWTEFDYCLRTQYNWRGRYIPVDGGIDGVDLNEWSPPRRADFFVALEILEHVYDPRRLLDAMLAKTDKGIAISTPNPATVDVFAMDPTHVIEVWPDMLAPLTTRIQSFYGQAADSIFGTYIK